MECVCVSVSLPSVDVDQTTLLTKGTEIGANTASGTTNRSAAVYTASYI